MTMPPCSYALLETRYILKRYQFTAKTYSWLLAQTICLIHTGLMDSSILLDIWKMFQNSEHISLYVLK